MIERESGLQEIAETGVMLHADISADLLVTVFSPKTPLHDGAVVIRGDTILAAGALLPSAETTIPLERFGTRHKAALGMTEQTDALVVVVSEESGQISLVERARIVRNLDEPKLARALMAHLHPQVGGGRLLRDAGRARPGKPSLRSLTRRARFGGRGQASEAPRKDRPDRRPAPRIEPPSADQPGADDDSSQTRAAS